MAAAKRNLNERRATESIRKDGNKMNFTFNINLAPNVEEIKTMLDEVLEKEESIMAELKEVTDALAVAAATTAEEKAEVAAALAAQDVQIQELTALVQTLKDQLAAGTAATEEDLDVVLESIHAISAAVEDITVPTPPAPSSGRPRKCWKLRGSSNREDNPLHAA